MLKSCIYCGGIHDEKERCPQAPISRNSKASRFRNTYAWNLKREEVKRRDRYLCLACFAENTLTYNNLEVHHITPIETDYELRLDNNNLITLCYSHHKKAECGDISAEYLKSLIPPTQTND